MLNAILNIANLILKVIAKSQADPDVQALVSAIDALIQSHGAPPVPPSPPAP